MRSEEASLWFVPANGGEELALLIKAPSASIKALVAGCALRLAFGMHGGNLSLTARIFDIPDSPLMISKAQRVAEEHQALYRALRERRLPVFLFSEMDVCLAWTNMELEEGDAARVIEFLGAPANLYSGERTQDATYVTDCLCYSLGCTDAYPDAKAIPFVDIPVSLEAWRSSKVSFIGHKEYHTIEISDRDEGAVLERAVWASLESVFPHALYKSPEVQIGEKLRELTDVLTIYEHGNFLFEAKDLSIIGSGFERTQERRDKGVRKQVQKAITQLIGASKAIRRGEKVFDAKGGELTLNREKPSHCIVLITEMMPTGDWGEVEAAVIDAAKETGDFFHVFDLREFINLLKGSSGNARLFDYNLMERFKAFTECGSVHLRIQFRHRPEGQGQQG
ncbi:hypothetical protein [Pandoraea apista]|uniref:Uncharacterized protein n=1 Tax=Pandoraea apista TaxID=93218 RepID=A0A5E5P6G8_9BURK|nr:hypothetical protein [Pandoraea apista]VVG72268.1 hypothetical protein PAP18089_03262 [Pandoraea apista]